MGKRDLSLEREWRRRMRRYEKSGLTIQDFCEEEDLVPHQFSWWRSELKRRDASQPRRKKRKSSKRGKRPSDVGADFIPVQVASSRASASLEIVLDEPLRIAVRSGFDRQLLADVLRALEQHGC